MVKNLSRRHFCWAGLNFLLGLLFSVSALAQQAWSEHEMKTAPPDKRSVLVPTSQNAALVPTSAGTVPFGKGLLWKIEPPSTATVAPSYIFGTMHSEDPRIARLSPAILQVFHASHTFCMELLTEDITSAAVAQRMLLTDGKTLEKVIGAQLFRQLVPMMNERGVPPTMLSLLKPWAVYMTLSMPKQETGKVLDSLLYEAARQQGKQVCGLESVEEQVNVFDRAPLAEQIVLLRQSVAEPDTLDQQLEQMTTKYLAQDLVGLLALSRDFKDATPDEQRSGEALLHRLIDERNPRMVERMLPRLKQGSAFIAVGALHLPGRTGILQMLTERGFSVIPLDS